MARAGKSLTYKVKWVLKVSIHCEGCKKKVKKILHRVEEYIDVYSVAVDLQQKKVTVTGNVDADVLIERLLKYGKHAELVPCKVPAKNDDKNQQPQPPPLLLKVQQSIPHEKSSDSSLANEGGTSGSPSPPQKKKPPDTKEEAPSQTKNSLEVNANGNDGTTTTKASNRPENHSTGPSGIKSTTAAAASVAAGETSRGSKQPAESARVVGDDSGKNKNKEVPIKGVPNRPRGEEAPKAAKLAGGDGGSVASPASSHYYPAHPQAHQPIYTTSHRTAQPSSSYPVNYSPPVPYTYAYGYAHPEGTASPPRGNFPGDGMSAFDLFSDENTNSCSLM